ncbi:TauD/TfdA family dioxygenase [Alkalihalophilus marmarensis]|uniref:TauD/TfdA family dioxygenase n=1 Tax=Alkalihalophilus marmarensis TaxID=521377 RepID=UPI00203EE804|nr:TauD/TfdA family dioxygenase [Alkalihalophilus marmarensis]MCM3491576.1 TauD/TfdA family dioxygenase [Alkalihalophilus marmarensis]
MKKGNSSMIETLLKNNEILSTVYQKKCFIPVHINSPNNVTQQQAAEIIENYNVFGFSIFQLNQPISNDMDLINLYKCLGLYQPFVPQIYQHDPEIYQKSGLNYIHRGQKKGNGERFHRAFQTTNNQKLHSDGTLEGIGQIKTSTLFCVNPAGEGGDNLIFNSVAAFFTLLKMSPNLACSMLEENALKRVDIGRTNRSSIGPAFKIENNKLISRFSMDNTCDWEYGFNQILNLRECFNQLNRFINLDSPYYTRIRLQRNQGLIMANHKISHGRTFYSETPDSQRKMIRGLFSNEPQLNHQVIHEINNA